MRADTAKPARRGSRRHVAVVVYEAVAAFELGVATDVFGLDRTAELGVPWYRLSVCAARPGTVSLDSGLGLQVTRGLGPLATADLVVVPPTEAPARVPGTVLAALRRAHRRGARILSLCTGASVLAASGLLDGRRAATHWSDCEELARRHPAVEVDARVLYVDDGDILTSAGSAASIDLCLHVVRRDHGAEVAARLARELVVPPYRDGGQAQYIEAPLPAAAAADPLAGVLAWMGGHLEQPMTVDDLAGRAAMSRRTFARRFTAATGTTPYRWLLRQRTARAQRLLETTDLPVDLVAEASGFGSAAVLRRHFGAGVRTSPQAYRRAFRARAAGAGEGA